MRIREHAIIVHSTTVGLSDVPLVRNMNVPDDPRGIPGRVKEVDEAVQGTETVEQWSSTVPTLANKSRRWLRNKGATCAPLPRRKVENPLLLSSRNKPMDGLTVKLNQFNVNQDVCTLFINLELGYGMKNVGLGAQKVIYCDMPNKKKNQNHQIDIQIEIKRPKAQCMRDRSQKLQSPSNGSGTHENLLWVFPPSFR